MLLLDLKLLFKMFRYCGVDRPSWSELRNFTHFFNSQLMDYERCSFTSVLCVNDLRGFKMFVIKFLLEMAQVEKLLSFLMFYFQLILLY